MNIKRDLGLFDLEVLQQKTRFAGVFAGDQIDLFQRFKGA
jgi:hypothetical protein